MRLPQSEGVGEPAEADLRNLTLTLPEGMTLNPSLAAGRTGCTDTPEAASGTEPERPGGQIELHTALPARCPNPSRIGEVTLHTPLFAQPLPGWVYLAAPDANPFGSLLAVYIVLEDPVSGVIVKLPAQISADTQTGRLTMTLSELPQLPFEELDLTLWGGQRAPLATPPGCAVATTTSQLTAWSSTPAEPVSAVPSSAFTVDQGCAPPGFAPAFSAGSVDIDAGGYTPFTLSLSRGDTEQPLGSVEAQLPPGVLAKIAGVQRCEEPQAAQGGCPQASQIGTVSVSAGVGPGPVYLPGTVYLTGPTLPEGPNQPGAPFGLAVEVPAQVGPLDLDEDGRPVVIRGAVRVDPASARLTLTTGPFPTILSGIPLHLRSINVTLDRPGFVLNPTNCSPLPLTGAVTSAEGATATVSTPFEVANCATLPFSPVLQASTGAHASLANGASLTLKVSSPRGQANLRSARIVLPRQLPLRLSTLQQACLDTVFDVNPAACPQASVIGTAAAHTPILSGPLSGPVYLVSHGGAAFPDIAAVLQGEGIEIRLDAVTDIEGNVTSASFESLPDVPFSSLEVALPEGPHSALGANTNLCLAALRMPSTLTAQNGAVVKLDTAVEAEGCPDRLTILSYAVRKRTVTLRLVVPGAGRLTASGRGLSTATRSIDGRGAITLTLKAQGHGTLKTRIAIRFTPARGRSLTAAVTASIGR